MSKKTKPTQKRRSPPTMLTLPKVAEMKGVSRIAVFLAVKEGRLAAIRTGRFWLVREDDARSWTPTGRRPLPKVKKKARAPK